MSKYEPDDFVVVRIETESGVVIHKILGGWHGGYTIGNSWRMSSGITEIQPALIEGDRWVVTNESGSEYHVPMGREMLTVATVGTWAMLEERAEVMDAKVSIVKLEDVEL